MYWLYSFGETIDSWLLSHGLTPHGVVAGEVVLCLIMLFFYARQRRSHLQRLAAGLAAHATDTPIQKWGDGQTWRKPTDIRLLEEKKYQLLKIEGHLREDRATAVSFHNRMTGANNFLQREWVALTTGFYGADSISQGTKLCEQLDRLWAGDAHMEIEDRKDKAKKLQLDRAALPKMEDFDRERKRFDADIINVERELRDLAELKRLAEKRTAETPKRAEYRGDLETHKIRMEDSIRKVFEGVETSLEIRKKQIDFLEQLNADPKLPEDEKEELRLMLKAAAKTAGTSTPVPYRKPGSIYEEGE